MRMHMELREYSIPGAKDSVWLFPCFYCGEPSNDEIPPTSVRARILSNGNHPKMMEVDCCRECNSALIGAQSLWTIKERRRYVAKWLAKRYEKLLKTPHWSEAELSSVKQRLRKRIEYSLRRKDSVRLRLEWARNK